MNRQRLIMIAALGSAALLLGAWGFQALGYAPCKMCIWQRWPHGAAFLIGMASLVVSFRLLPLLGALAAAVTGGIGVYHAGVEQHWWQGPDTCTSGDIGGLSSEELMQKILAAPLVRCDEIAWQFAGLSMASWNAILSFSLVAVWLLAWRRI
jgi:disulfide bond formation protein DsbB